MQLAAGAAFDRTTPGRLMNFVATGVIFLHQTTYSVFNRTDKMLDIGFQGDAPAIFGQVRPGRQVFCFSATWSAMCSSTREDWSNVRSRVSP